MGDEVRKVWRLVGTQAKGRWLLVVALSLLSAGAEAAAAALIFALLKLLSSGSEGGRVQTVLDAVLPSSDEEARLMWLCGLLAAFFVVRSVLLVLQQYVSYRVSYNAGARLAAQLHRLYLGMPYENFVERRSSELIRNAVDGTQSFVNDVVVPLTLIVSEGCIVAGILTVLLLTGALVTPLAVVALGAVAYLMLRLVHPKVKLLGQQSQESWKQSLGVFQESLNGFREVALMGAQDEFVQRFYRRRTLHARAKYMRGALSQVPRAGLEAALVLFVVGFLITIVVIRGNASSATAVLGVFGYAAVRLQPSVNRLTVSLNAVKFGAAAVEQIYADVVGLSDREFAAPRARAKKVRIDGGIERAGESSGSPHTAPVIALERVCFEYRSRSGKVLNDVSLTIRPGSWVGIVGQTGSGKSTLLDLMVGLLSPTEGTIHIDGVSIFENLVRWRGQISLVSQKVFLLDDSLRRNVAFGRPDAAIDENRVQHCLRIAQLRDFVETLPEGVHTMVGEHGVHLSGGQGQRLALARALYREGSVLFLDEATSALDARTEEAVMAGVSSLRPAKTLVSIAHRIATVRNCDEILVLEHGRVAATGSYDELLDRSMTFRNLVMQR